MARDLKPRARQRGGREARSPVHLRLDLTHTAASRAAVSERRLRRVARLALPAADQQGRFAIALAFVTDARMRRLNREFAGNDYVTDVLSFAAREDAGAFHVPPSGGSTPIGPAGEAASGDPKGLPDFRTAARAEGVGSAKYAGRGGPEGDIMLGDIVIALPQAARQAREAGHPLARELDLLVAHGVLHLLGYDHGVPADARRMETLQAQILASSVQAR